MDSPSVFARLLDAGSGGCWQIRPTGKFRSSRRYQGDTAIIEMTFETSRGRARLTDFMPPHSAGLERAMDSAIIRIVEGVEGEVEFENHFEPRFDYARAEADWTKQPGTGVRATFGEESLTLQTKQPLTIADGAARGRFRVGKGMQAVFVLTYRSPVSLFWRSEIEGEAEHLLEQTRSYWTEWIRRCKYEGPYEHVVKRSAITLRLLDYAPTGAMVAAPTTSLPEVIGGVRNWDYRFSWMRDTAFTLYSFYVLGYHEEGETFLSWILDMTRGDPRSLKVLYGIGGERETPEFELDHLEGYRGSRPVRIGNAAQDQKQLDIFGELLDCAYLLYRYGGRFSDELWPLLRAAVDHVCDIWKEPDEGLWEVRSGPRQFVYSKALCWVAVDRGIRLGERLGFPFDEVRWKEARDEILAQVMEQGYNAERGAFTQAYGHSDLDAAVLSFPLRGVISANDPRMASTIRRIEEELSTDGLIHRVSQTFEDGLPGKEGAFVLCSFWLVDCYTLQGDIDKARAAYEKLLTYTNDVGLLSEEIDPKSGAQLGNFPQAFAHVALINSAANLARADRESAERVEEAVAEPAGPI
jgi:alpha,alpha-trehalase